MLYRTLKPIALALMRLLFRLEVHGREQVPAAGPLLLVSNHVSLLDPPIVGGAAPRDLHYLAKEELFGVPVLGWLIRRLNARPVKRDGADGRALKTGLRLLRYGRALLVGLLNTLLVAGLGIALATLLGFILGMARLSHNWLIHKIAAVYIETLRNIPVLLQLLFWYRAVLSAMREKIGPATNPP